MTIRIKFIEIYYLGLLKKVKIKLPWKVIDNKVYLVINDNQ